jgi:hypothetical protein
MGCILTNMNNTATTNQHTAHNTTAWETIIGGLDLKAGDKVNIIGKPFIDSERLDLEEGLTVLGSDSLHLILSRPDRPGRFYFSKKTILVLELAD